MKINLKDIAMDVNYRELGFLQNHLMHEVKRMSVEEFVTKYESQINDIVENDYEYNMVVAVLKKVGGELCTLEPKKLERYVADPRIVIDYVKMNGDVSEEDITEIQETLNEYADKYVPEFENCGLLLYSFDDAM